MGASRGLPAELSLTDHTLYFHAKVAFIVTYSKVPIIRTGTYASSAVHAMYCRNGPTYDTYDRNFKVPCKV